MKEDVLMNNISKLSEDYLAKTHDKLCVEGREQTALGLAIDCELDRRATIFNAAVEVRKEAERQKESRLQVLRDSYADIELVFGRGRVSQAMRNEFGEEFIEDYEITDKFTVLSHCKNTRNPNLNNVWECGNHEEAQKRLLKLIYYRVYDHYFRNPSEESMVRLEAAIAELQ